jgi:hypothetical protein
VGPNFAITVDELKLSNIIFNAKMPLEKSTPNALIYASSKISSSANLTVINHY